MHTLPGNAHKYGQFTQIGGVAFTDPPPLHLETSLSEIFLKSSSGNTCPDPSRSTFPPANIPLHIEIWINSGAEPNTIF